MRTEEAGDPGVRRATGASPHVLPRFAALDGIRGVAVVAVLLDHGGLRFAKGGFLGVTVFFTLSGFLITSLLLIERDVTGAIDLRAFWSRRARRLVPGSVVAIGLSAALLPRIARLPSGIIGDAASASTWVANWRFVFAERTYADLFSSPSPFQHFWSLAVEEQFYVVFPLLVAGVIGAAKTVPRKRIALVVAGLVAGSLVVSLTLYDAANPYRAYYGTDARAGEILVGALLAIALLPHTPKGTPGLPRLAAQGAGIIALPVLLLAFVAAHDFDRRLFEGGFLAVAAATAALIASAMDSRTFAAKVLRVPPLVFVGRISYGVYLYHWPIFLTLTERSTGLTTGSLFAVRCAVTVAVATASFFLLEQPLREGRVLPNWPRTAWANATIAGLAVVTLASGEIGDLPGTVEVAGGARPAPAAPTIAAVAPEADLPSAVAAAVVPGAPAPTTLPPRPGERSRNVPATLEQPAPTRRAAAPDALYQDPAKAEIPPQPAGAASKLRVAVLGDSVGLNLGRGLTTWSDERGDVAVLNVAVSACPISRGGDRRFGPERPFPVDTACGWWADPATDRYKALREFAPDVIVLQDGINEMFDRKLPEWDDFRRPGDPRFDRWLIEEYQDLLAAHGDGVAVVVTNALCGDWGRYEAFDEMSDPDLRIRSINASVYSRLPNVTEADIFNRVCPGGRYTDEVEGVPNGRPDGLHFSDEAAAALARNWLGPLVLDAASKSGRGGLL
jgi:peptidoglycan/LPS O-acetylase OafA/YrhL